MFLNYVTYLCVWWWDNRNLLQRNLSLLRSQLLKLKILHLLTMMIHRKMSLRMRNQLLKRQLLLPRLQAVQNHLMKILMRLDSLLNLINKQLLMSCNLNRCWFVWFFCHSRKVKMKSLHLKRLSPRQLKRIAVVVNLTLTNQRVKMRKKPQRKRCEIFHYDSKIS